MPDVVTPDAALQENQTNPNPSLQQAVEVTERIRSLLRLKQNRYTLRGFLARLHFADLAEVLEAHLERDEALQTFTFMAPTKAAEVLPSLSYELQHDCLLTVPPAKASRIIRHMAADDAVDLLQSLSPEHRRAFLGELPLDADTRAIHQLLSEEPDTAAGLMSTEFIHLPADATVEQALLSIRQADERTFVYYIFLTDREGRLVGVLSLRKLMQANSDQLLNEVATFDIKSVLDSFDQEIVVKLFRKYYNLLAIPVVDSHEKLIGLITLDDIIDIIDEESQEDLYRASGIILDDEADERNLLHGPVMDAVKARLPWLSITMVGQLVTATIIASFQPTVSQAVIAFSFLPLLCGLSGNIGTQSDTITVRGVALDIVHPDNIRHKLSRELRVASVIGGTFAILVGAAAYILYRQPLLSLLLVGFIFTAACISASLGMLIPYIIHHKLGKDPAGVGGPFITTSMDLMLYISYLTVLTVLVKHLV